MIARVAAVDKIGGALARHATGARGLSEVTMLDEGVLAPFGSADYFRAMVDGNNRRGRRLITAIHSSTPSDGVLNSIQSVQDKFNEIHHDIKILVEKKEDFSSTDLMKMQYNVMQLTYLNELSSKTADKTSQGAQTLFRNQG
jgi:hypothetical protein